MKKIHEDTTTILQQSKTSPVLRITIPAQVRTLLQLKKGDKLHWTTILENEEFKVIIEKK